MESRASALRAYILAALRRRRGAGATCDELETALRLSHQTVSARLRELALAREVVTTDQRRATRRGRKARVYVAHGWGVARGAAGAPATAPRAAKRLVMGGAHRTILAYVARHAPRGVTCDELERATELPHQTASAYLRELVRLGAIKDSGARRATRTGRAARVYVEADGG